MKHIQLMLGSLMLFGLTACQTPKIVTEQQPVQQKSLQVDGKIYAAFFQQRAAEYQALSQQAYNVAKMRLDEAIATKGAKPLAIVTDIDETFLDNSYYAVEMARQGKTWSQETWANWTSKGIATPLAGSQEFFQYAASVNEFTVAPQVNPAEGLPYHEWLIEFDQKPQDITIFNQELDTQMRRQNTYYDDLITGNILRPLVVSEVKTEGFQHYMKSIGKLGGQNKVPRLSNNREIADEFYSLNLITTN